MAYEKKENIYRKYMDAKNQTKLISDIKDNRAIKGSKA